MTMVADLDTLIDHLTVDAYDDEEQLSGFHVGAEEALRRDEHATIVGSTVEVVAVDCGPDARTGLLARVRRDGATYHVGLADLTFGADSELGSSSPRIAAGRADEQAADRADHAVAPDRG